eukprot:g1430.t1
MRAVVQRVKSASVQVEFLCQLSNEIRTQVDGKVVSSIGPGLLCLIGLKKTDTQLDADFLCRKILRTKLWPRDDGNQWQMSVQKVGYEVLLVSQFTLYARLKGTKPDFSQAMSFQEAREMYSEFVDTMKKSYHSFKIKDGVFGAMMNVSLENDGPVTVIMDSTKRSTNTAPDYSDSEEEITDDQISAIEKA